MPNIQIASSLGQIMWNIISKAHLPTSCMPSPAHSASLLSIVERWGNPYMKELVDTKVTSSPKTCAHTAVAEYFNLPGQLIADFKAVALLAMPHQGSRLSARGLINRLFSPAPYYPLVCTAHLCSDFAGSSAHLSVPGTAPFCSTSMCWALVALQIHISLWPWTPTQSSLEVRATLWRCVG